MRRWLHARLRRVMSRLESPASFARGRDPGAELAYLEQQLLAIEQDEATLSAMLAQHKDSFHHSIAAGNTTHVESVQERKARVISRIENLKETL